MIKKRLGISLILIGIALFSFPFASMIHKDFKQLHAAENYQSYVKKNHNNLKKSRLKVEETQLDTQGVQDIFTQDKESAEQQVSPYDSLLDTSKVLGRVDIPSLGQNFDLYLDADYDKIAKGVATLVGTGAPIGVKGKRPIIAGHRFTYNDMSFYFIPDLKNGDKIYVTFLDQTLEYEVYHKEIINEYDTAKLNPIKDQDVITLMTCYNGPEYNERYLVDARRVEKKTTSDNGKHTATITSLLTQKESKFSVKLLRLTPYLLVSLGLLSFLFFSRKLYQLSNKNGSQN